METAGLCQSCRNAPPSFTALRAWAVFDGSLRSAIHQLKYQRDLALGEALARNLVKMLENLQWKIDLVIPVPLGKARQAERQYNQAALLALPVALGCQAAYRPQGLIRARETRSQVGLAAALRRENVKDAFLAQAEIVRGQHVLVVDDVTTSGATMEACAAACRAAGAHQVFGLALARPRPHLRSADPWQFADSTPPLS